VLIHIHFCIFISPQTQRLRLYFLQQFDYSGYNWKWNTWLPSTRTYCALGALAIMRYTNLRLLLTRAKNIINYLSEGGMVTSSASRLNSCRPWAASSCFSRSRHFLSAFSRLALSSLRRASILTSHDHRKHCNQWHGMRWIDWIEQCFTSPPTQYRLYGRRFLHREIKHTIIEQ